MLMIATKPRKPCICVSEFEIRVSGKPSHYSRMNDGLCDTGSTDLPCLLHGPEPPGQCCPQATALYILAENGLIYGCWRGSFHP